MRIVGGNWKGRRLSTLSDKMVLSDLRPTMDRVRETIFNILIHGVGFEVKGVRVLDLFCGTGALGFEALSRGAKQICFVDIENRSLNVVSDNMAMLQAEEEVVLLNRDATKLDYNFDLKYQLVFLDPPYSKGLGERAISSALEKGWISQDAIVVWEERDQIWPPKELHLFDSRTVGNSSLNFLRRCD